MEERLVELESRVSHMEVEVGEIDALKREVETLTHGVQELCDEVDLDNLVDCIRWIVERLKTIEKRLAIIPPANPCRQKPD